MPELDGTMISALFAAIGAVVVAYLGYAAKQAESKNNKDKQGIEALTAAIQEWKSIAERAERKAELAYQEAKAARESAERAEHDTVALIKYMRVLWQGVINGTVPPPPPIPENLKHLISSADFPWRPKE